MSNVQLIENLRRLRKDHKLTQMQISKMLNISRQAYSNYETGQRIPDVDTLLRLSDFYHITLEQLITQPCSGMGIINENQGPYTTGIVIDQSDTVYLAEDEITLLSHYRNASKDDRRLVRKVLDLPD